MQHDNRCVCEICTCGQHHCPVNPFEGMKTNPTTFQSDYVPHKCQKNPNFKQPEYAVNRPYNKDDLKSIYNNDYDKKHVNNPKIHPQKIPATTTLPFAQDSEYKTRYQQFNQQPKQKPIKQEESLMNIPFTSQTVYNQDFKNFDRQRPQKNQYNPNTFKPRNNFDGQTTYGTDFHNHKFDPMKPTLSTHKPYTNDNIPFQNNTVYNQSYVRFPQHQDNYCPVTKLPQRPKNCSPGKKHLYYKQTKNQWI